MSRPGGAAPGLAGSYPAAVLVSAVLAAALALAAPPALAGQHHGHGQAHHSRHLPYLHYDAAEKLTAAEARLAGLAALAPAPGREPGRRLPGAAG